LKERAGGAGKRRTTGRMKKLENVGDSTESNRRAHRWASVFNCDGAGTQFVGGRKRKVWGALREEECCVARSEYKRREDTGGSGGLTLPLARLRKGGSWGERERLPEVILSQLVGVH